MSSTSKLLNWEVTQGEDGVVTATFSRQNSSANTLNSDCLDEFVSILDELQQDKKTQGLVIRSGKKSGFIFGADINEIAEADNIEAIEKFLAKGHEAFTKLEQLTIPTVAHIVGFCLGGGLELALGCDWRVAEDSTKTKLGLPEVKLGIYPGWGGSVRLPNLVGSLCALPLIIQGKMLSATAAYRIGLVDAAVPTRAAERAIKAMLAKGKRSQAISFFERIVTANLVRPFVAKFLKYKVKKKVNPKHYPAPFAVIRSWKRCAPSRKEKALGREIQAVAKLAQTKVASNLVRVFNLQNQLKSYTKAVPCNIKHVHVIGAGTMGGDIAAYSAMQGFKVTLEDTNIQAIAATLGRAQKLFKKKLRALHLINSAKDRLLPDAKGLGRKKADLVIEAIIEDADVKQELFAKLEQECAPDAILATNTSTIPLATINANLQDKNRVIGIHFFNPVALMPLVEVVSQEKTAEELQQAAFSFVGKLGKLPLPVASVPGFLVNRVLFPYLNEGMLMIEEGISPELVDKAALDFGMPMGPIELIDVIGLDVCVAAAAGLGAKVPEIVSSKVAAGDLGKKSGQGFYRYRKGRVKKAKLDYSLVPPSDTKDRLLLCLLHQAQKCYREGVVSSSDLVDAGMIFGAGFSPFLGGPLHHLSEEQGALFSSSHKLKDRYGVRFALEED